MPIAGSGCPWWRHAARGAPTAAQLPDLLADAHHVELPWAGHLPSLERPSAVTDLLVAFLHEKIPAG
jgi:pimeloyl-ACP methyl ester carboxylesterase